MYDSLMDGGGDPPATNKARRDRKFRLIEGWHRAWRYWSVQLNALAMAMLALLLYFPDVARELWSGLPDELKAVLPSHFAYWVPVAIGTSAVIARVIKQQESPNNAVGATSSRTAVERID